MKRMEGEPPAEVDIYVQPSVGSDGTYTAPDSLSVARV